MLSNEEKNQNINSIDFRKKPYNNNGSFNIFVPKSKCSFL